MLPILSALMLAACSTEVEPKVPYTEGDPAQAEEVAKRQEEAERASYKGGDDAEVERPAKLNANTATEDELKAAIDGLGDKMAHEIDEYRPYKSVAVFEKEMIKYVKDPDIVARYLDAVYIPIAIDDCDAKTLMQIEGLTKKGAEAVIAGRPYGSVDAFTKALEPHVKPAEIAYAKPWFVQ